MTVPHRSRLAPAAVAMAIMTATVVTMVMAGCGGSSTRSAETTTTAAGATAANGVPDALQFTAALVGGGQFDGTTLAGKPVMFWFWAPT